MSCRQCDEQWQGVHHRFETLGGDTLKWTIVVQRPEQQLFKDRFAFVLGADSVAPTPAEIAEFKNRLARGRRT